MPIIRADEVQIGDRLNRESKVVTVLAVAPAPPSAVRITTDGLKPFGIRDSTCVQVLRRN